MEETYADMNEVVNAEYRGNYLGKHYQIYNNKKAEQGQIVEKP